MDTDYRQSTKQEGFNRFYKVAQLFGDVLDEMSQMCNIKIWFVENVVNKFQLEASRTNMTDCFYDLLYN